MVATDLFGTVTKGIYYLDDGGKNYIDTGSGRTLKVFGTAEFNRHWPGAGSWDNIPGNWETWSGPFDTWTDEQNDFPDHSVVHQARVTNDDPTSDPIVWGPWTKAEGGTLVGRAVQFRTLLNSTSDGGSPSIETLSYTVEY